MARYADLVGQFVEHRPQLPQDVAHVGLHFRAARGEHRTILVIDDLDAQAFRGQVDQQLRPEAFQDRAGLDDVFKAFFQVFQAVLFAAFGVAHGLGLDPVTLAAAHIAFATQRVAPAAGHRAGFRRTAGAARDGHAQRHAEVFRDALEFLARHDTDQPHHKEEGHHGRDEVGVCDLPAAPVVPAALDLLAADHHTVIVYRAHGPLRQALPVAVDLVCRTCSSSSPKVGRTDENSTLRPNSTANWGG
ncbi:hypothetical protein D3C71_971590 [compost metagenome]